MLFKTRFSIGDKSYMLYKKEITCPNCKDTRIRNSGSVSWQIYRYPLEIVGIYAKVFKNLEQCTFYNLCCSRTNKSFNIIDEDDLYHDYSCAEAECSLRNNGKACQSAAGLSS